MATKKFKPERFTEDMLIEVLVRLPVKHLIRCKVVSKTWFSLISSHEFIKSHLHRSITARGDDETLIAHLYKDEEDESTYDYDSFALICFGSEQVVADLKYPYSEGEYSVQPDVVAIASDCGIVCVSICNHIKIRNDRYNDLYEKKLYLWNPATKQSKLIRSHTTHDVWERCTFGFGFDQAGLDCKVVRIVSHLLPSGTLAYSSVYSANMNSWREFEGELTDIPCKYNFDVCLHGFLLCTGYKGMMAFDLKKEVFICGVELPVIGDRKSSNTKFNNFESTISDFKDSIAVTISNYEGLNDKYFNLWTLDDEACLRGDEVKASWTKMLSIYVGTSIDSVVGYFNHRDIMLVDKCGELFWYKSDENKRTIAPFSLDRWQIFKYAESLITIAGSKQVRWNAREDNN